MSTAIYKHLDYFGNRSDTMGVHYLCKLAHCSLNTYGLLGLGLQDHGQQGLPCCTWLPSRFWRHWLPSRLWLWLRFSFAWRRWLHCHFWQLHCHFWLHGLLRLGLQDHRRQGLPCCSWLPSRFWRHWLPSRLWRRWRQLRSLGLQMIAASESHIVVQKIIFREDDRCLCFIPGMLGVDSLGHLQTFVSIPNVLLSHPKAPLGSRPLAALACGAGVWWINISGWWINISGCWLPSRGATRGATGCLLSLFAPAGAATAAQPAGTQPLDHSPYTKLSLTKQKQILNQMAEMLNMYMHIR